MFWHLFQTTVVIYHLKFHLCSSNYISHNGEQMLKKISLNVTLFIVFLLPSRSTAEWIFMKFDTGDISVKFVSVLQDWALYV